MKKILVSNLMMLKEKKRFSMEISKRGYKAVFPKVNQYLKEDEALAYAGKIDGWLAGDDLITHRVLKEFYPKLQVISKWGSGIDSIDLSAAKEFKIPVLNSPGAFSDAVAEVAVGYLLNLSRNISLTDRLVRSGQWPKTASSGVVNKNIGILGFGSIGREIGSRCKNLKANIFFNDPLIKKSSFKYAKRLTFKNLLKKSDYLILACDLNESNHHIINKNTISFMKKGSSIINVSRGKLICEKDLIQALKVKYISSVALDVYEEEPLSKGSKLMNFKNVILGSHNANNLDFVTEIVHQNTLANLFKYI
tara:strand:+ start:14526 stop:15446 length:921 start_codon:yes stop_codon:yes gene_type:complete